MAVRPGSRDLLSQSIGLLHGVAAMTNPRLWQPQDDAVTIMNRMGSECERLADEFVKLKTEESAAESTKLMTPAEAAEYFQVSESLIKRQAPEMESAGLAVHIGKQWRFKRV